MNPKSIWIEAQNRPSLVVRDLASVAPEGIVYESLLRRGVFKWLTVRFHLIRLKNVWKDRVRDSIARQKAAQGPDVNYWRGYRKGIEECRAEVRALCHSERFVAPPNDPASVRWLARYSERNQ